MRVIHGIQCLAVHEKGRNQQTRYVESVQEEASFCKVLPRFLLHLRPYRQPTFRVTSTATLIERIVNNGLVVGLSAGRQVALPALDVGMPPIEREVRLLVIKIESAPPRGGVATLAPRIASLRSKLPLVPVFMTPPAVLPGNPE